MFWFFFTLNLVVLNLWRYDKLKYHYIVIYWFLTPNTIVQGPCHTRHFCTQYCYILIKRYWGKNIILGLRFQWSTKASSKKTYHDFFCLYTLIYFFDKSFRHPWLKIIFLSQYLFVAILCVKILCVKISSVFQSFLVPDTLFD